MCNHIYKPLRTRYFEDGTLIESRICVECADIKTDTHVWGD